ncbi:permease [Planctomycetota bacterium]
MNKHPRKPISHPRSQRIDAIKNILMAFWGTIAEMSPYLLFGFFMAGVLSVLISQEFVARHLGGHGWWPVIKASLFGVPLPLCSCSVIPVSMSLFDRGASRGATTAFLLSTPQTGVDSIFVTYSLLGPVLAVFRPLAAFVTGLIGGGATNLLIQAPAETPDKPAPHGGGCCCAQQPSPKRWREGLFYGFVSLPRSIGKPLLVGLALAAAIAVFVPEGFFAGALGTGLGAMLLMMVFGIPLYVCATASIPVAAALILKGVSPGAVLVFLMTGPATNAAGLATIWKTLGRRTALVYLGTVVVCALGAGLLFDQLSGWLAIDPHLHNHIMAHRWWQHAAGVLLLVILANAIRPSPS